MTGDYSPHPGKDTSGIQASFETIRLASLADTEQESEQLFTEDKLLRRIEAEIHYKEFVVMYYLHEDLENVRDLEDMLHAMTSDKPLCMEVVTGLEDLERRVSLTDDDLAPIRNMATVAHLIGSIATYSGRIAHEAKVNLQIEIISSTYLSNEEKDAFLDAVDHFISDPKAPDSIRKEVGMLFTNKIVAGYDVDMNDINFITLRSLVQKAAVANSPEAAERGVDEILQGFNINKADYSQIIRDIISLAREEQE